MSKMTEEQRQAVLAEYEIGKTVTMGSYQGRVLRWRVLEANGKMRLLVAEDVVAERPYNELYVDTSWRTCSLRRWLNGEFLREAFTLEERTKILNTRVSNPPNPKYYTNGGLDSVDKLFALSIGEAEEYLPSNEARALGKWWWLRSPGNNLLSAVSVYEDGSIYETGINDNYVDGGVRPAMWVLLRV